MRISVDIDDNLLRDVMAMTGEKNKSPALAKAVSEYARRERARDFGRLLRDGAFDYPDHGEPVKEDEEQSPLW